MVVDLRRNKAPVTPVSIQGNNVDIVQDYKYLGVHIDNKLDWAKNTDSLYRKLKVFYESVVASVILFAVACWGSRLRVPTDSTN